MSKAAISAADVVRRATAAHVVGETVDLRNRTITEPLTIAHRHVANIDFSGAVFAAPVCFAGATFAGLAWFRGCTFMADADFSSCLFENDVRFDAADIRAALNFRNVELRGVGGFDNVRFGWCSKFRECRRTRQPFFRQHDVRGRVELPQRSMSRWPLARSNRVFRCSRSQ